MNRLFQADGSAPVGILFEHAQWSVFGKQENRAFKLLPILAFGVHEIETALRRKEDGAGKI